MTYSLSKQGETEVVAGLKVKDFKKLHTYEMPTRPGSGAIFYDFITARANDKTHVVWRALTEAEKAALDRVNVPANLIKLLWAIQCEYPDYAIGITDHGGERNEVKLNGQLISLNKAVKGANGSQHKYGRGADISLRHRQTGAYMDTSVLAVEAERIMLKIGLRGGVGIYGKQHNYIHVDVRGSWAAWFCSYDGRGCPAQGGRYAAFKKGHSAAGIKLIQRALIKLGGDYAACAPEDGVWGEKTDVAVRLFQSRHGLKADGIYGKGTNKILGALPWQR